MNIKIGMIFKFNKIHPRWHGEISKDVLMVVSEEYERYAPGSIVEDYLNYHSWRFRRLLYGNGNREHGQLLNNSPINEPDDITIVGQLPADKLRAILWEGSFAVDPVRLTGDLENPTILSEDGHRIKYDAVCVEDEVNEGECDHWHSDGSVSKEECECWRCKGESPNKLIRFLKRIW